MNAGLSLTPRAPKIRLAQHPIARGLAAAREVLPSGAAIAHIPALSSCLLPSEKGRRCDWCHHLQSESVTLRRCSRCAAFWYCDNTCQDRDWKARHKKICRNYNAFIASSQYQALTAHDQVDALLLSHLVTEPAAWDGKQQHHDLDNPISALWDLLKLPRADGLVPPLCLSKSVQTAETLKLAEELYARFGNNNFVLHSHLNSYGHGIFPYASRLFNHSCVPNAACKYVITPTEPVVMEVVSLYQIAEGEEITLPYLDPALPYQTRQEALRANYDFQCTCRLCTFQRGIEPVPAPALRGTAELKEVDAAIRSFALGDISQEVRIPMTPGLFERLPAELYPIFHESYLPSLSEQFSKTSHEGPYADAVEAGLTLLAFYVVIYPPNYPQIGMHALELTKTLWNLLCAEPDALAGPTEDQLMRHTKSAVDFAASVLRNYGPEGDDGGPLEEIRVLTELLSSQ
ncbi:SET domain-containing protein [Lentinus tigrinus ALCF2SS1-7]|uniref:SET domain-containing protein n=1 Tax=Lentinus tigrinus ALCF2SS1-6 TaxID=1328759 RepID=A0A5C2SF90_9APHY|nr:SET domain-containing protein [Lentinus tigrinus ALCF2SS1-6]RPD77890.1 SET domain-containing protein [Lentinus tigrinus ALCF2SS1-7]